MINFTNWRARAPTQVWPPTAVQDLYGYLPVTVPSISSAACLIAFSLWDYAHHRALTLWLCAMLLVQLLRTVLLFAFRHSSQADQALPHWTWLWIFTASCTGALLGFANTYFFAPIPVVELVLATLTAAFVGSGWSVVAPSIVALILYVSLPLIPLAIQFALVGNRGEGVVAFALAAMVVACIAFGLRWRHMYFESLSREAALEDARRAAESANTAKTKFVAAASHDLRQPMQALSMYASVLEQRVKDERAQRVVQGIQLSVRALEQLFDSLLDIAKLESGVITPNPVAFPLMPLIERVAETERGVVAAKHLNVRVVRCSVRSDPILLERMVKNLLTNAIRYTERGGIIVGCRRVGRDRVRIEIVDSGIGIPSEEQEQIFDDYYQIQGATAQGLGLGLPIVKRLAELLGHRLAVRSTFGRGSVFSIELERASLPMAIESDSTELSEANFSGACVVIVDDDVEIRNSMGLLLEHWGCRPITGRTLTDIERQLQEHGITPTALIADYRLADVVTGLQIIERLRQSVGKKLPALLVTGTANLLAVQQRAGDIPVVSKPVPPGKLRSFLSQSLRHRASRQARTSLDRKATPDAAKAAPGAPSAREETQR